MSPSPALLQRPPSTLIPRYSLINDVCNQLSVTYFEKQKRQIYESNSSDQPE